MASNRHLGRIVALQTLYEYDFREECQDVSLVLSEVLSRNVERYSETIEDKTFIQQLVSGVVEHRDQIDDVVRPIAPEWPIEQIARIDRNVLRMALWELRWGNDAPPKVVINEAVELAKAFGSENSSKFVNGVLGTAFRQQTEDEENAKPAAKKKTPAKAAAKKPAPPKSQKKKST